MVIELFKMLHNIYYNLDNIIARSVLKSIKET